jgi:hypothetical protein
VRKLRRIGGRADAEVDRALDAGMDAVHDLVSARLGEDPALAALEEQVPAGGESERTVRRVTDAIADAAETDPRFAARLGRLVEELRAREQAGGSVASGERSVAMGGDNTGIISTGDGATNVQQQAEASDGGRVYQAGRDQTVHDR